MFGYCAQLFRKSSGQDAVNAGMQVHFKSQQRRTGLSRKSPSGEIGSCLHCVRCARCSPATVSQTLLCDQRLPVSLSHTTKCQHAFSFA